MITHRGFDIYIEQDHCAGDSPRDWEPMSTIVSWGAGVKNECKLIPGDEELIQPEGYGNEDAWYDARRIWYVTNVKLVAILPLYGGYGHNHHDYNTINGRNIGFIYMTREMFDENYSEEWMEEYHKGRSKGDVARDIMRSELKTFSQWKNGDVYGYRIEGLDDSCFGFYGNDHEESELLANARASINWEINRQTKHHCKRLKNMIKNKVELNKRIAYAYR
jgi:hypothetical protein